MPFILIAIITAIICLDPFLPLGLKQLLYSLSLTIKSLIIFLLPFLIFGLLFKALNVLAGGATRIIALILALVCCSNFLSTFLSHYVGQWIYGFELSMIAPHESNGLAPLWSIDFGKFIANDKAMFAGIILGLVSATFFPVWGRVVSFQMERIISYILKGIVTLIPLFVAGFVIKLQYDGVMTLIAKDYTTIFAMIAIAQLTYLLLAYFLINRGNISQFINSLKNMLPAAISGFSTMSSAASMPLMIIGAESNSKNKDIANSVIPATVNVHLVGDCLAIPIFAYAVLKSYGMAEPSLWQYLIFVFYFVIAKFSVAAIPGGGIIVMLPILEEHLGFNTDMLSLITGLYILFDPVITCANVLGNGAFAQMIDRLVIWLGIEKKQEEQSLTIID